MPSYRHFAMMVAPLSCSRDARSVPAFCAKVSRAALLPASTRGGSACFSILSTTCPSLSSSRSASSPAPPRFTGHATISHLA